MKNRFLFLLIYATVFLNYVNVFAAKHFEELSDTQKLYIAILADPSSERLIALVRSGINIDTEEDKDIEKMGFTALHVASYHGLCSAIPELLAAGANINKPVAVSNKKLAGLTALQLGIIPSVVHALLSNHASTEPRDITLQCFNSFLKDVAPVLPIRNSIELEIIRGEIIKMARELVLVGFQFGEEINSYLIQNFSIRLSDLA